MDESGGHAHDRLPVVRFKLGTVFWPRTYLARCSLNVIDNELMSYSIEHAELGAQLVCSLCMKLLNENAELRV